MKKVMLVDDDERLRRIAGAVLRRNGCEVLLAHDGEECLQKLRAGFRGVVLMDIAMPGLTGWQTIRVIADENLIEGVLICMLTSIWSPRDEGQGLENLVFDYLPKPFGNLALTRCVDNASSFLAA